MESRLDKGYKQKLGKKFTYYSLISRYSSREVREE